MEIKIDLGKFKDQIKYEETVKYETRNVVVHYFIAPKELLDDKYPEAEHACLMFEDYLDDETGLEYRAALSPTKDGEDYDWTDIDISIHDAYYLTKLAYLRWRNDEQPDEFIAIDEETAQEYTVL